MVGTLGALNVYQSTSGGLGSQLWFAHCIRWPGRGGHTKGGMGETQLKGTGVGTDPGIQHQKGMSAIPAISCSGAYGGGMSSEGGRGGGPPRSVAIVQTYTGILVNGAGTITTHIDGPKRLRQGKTNSILPPNESPA